MSACMVRWRVLTRYYILLYVYRYMEEKRTIERLVPPSKLWFGLCVSQIVLCG